MRPAYSYWKQGWGLANNASMPFFEELARSHQNRYRAVSGAMDTWNSMIPTAPLVETYPWEAFVKGQVVDVGGGHGGVSSAIATRFPNIRFVVQDLPAVAQEGPEHVPSEVKDRIEFMHHNFFHEQPVQGG